jgi:hypothetical protein
LLPSIANTGTLRRATATDSTSARAPSWSGKSESYKEGPKASKADHQRFLVLLSAEANIVSVNIVPLLYSTRRRVRRRFIRTLAVFVGAPNGDDVVAVKAWEIAAH